MGGLCFIFAVTVSNNLEPLRFVVSWVVDSLQGSDYYVTRWEMGPPIFMQSSHGAAILYSKGWHKW